MQYIHNENSVLHPCAYESGFYPDTLGLAGNCKRWEEVGVWDCAPSGVQGQTPGPGQGVWGPGRPEAKSFSLHK